MAVQVQNTSNVTAFFLGAEIEKKVDECGGPFISMELLNQCVCGKVSDFRLTSALCSQRGHVVGAKQTTF